MINYYRRRLREALTGDGNGNGGGRLALPAREQTGIWLASVPLWLARGHCSGSPINDPDIYLD